MPTIAERLETATSDLEAAVETLSTAVDTCTEKADTATTQAGIATTKAGEASDSADAAAAAAATAGADAAAVAVAAVQDDLDDEVTAAETARAGAETARAGAEAAQLAATAVVLTNVASDFSARLPATGYQFTGTGGAFSVPTAASPRFMRWKGVWPAAGTQGGTFAQLIRLGTSANNGWNLYFNNSTGGITVRIFGASAGDYTQFSTTTVPTAGEVVDLLLCSNGSAQPIIYLNGTALTNSSDGSTGGGGSWSSIEAATWSSGDVAGSITYATVLEAAHGNVALSSLEVAILTRYGWAGLPQYVHAGGAGQVIYQSDFSAGADSFSPPSNVTATGGVNTDADGAGVPPSDGWLRLTRSTGTGSLYATRSFTNRVGKEYARALSVFIPTGSPVTHVATGNSGTSTVGGGTGYGAVSDGLNALSVRIRPQADGITLAVTDSAGSLTSVAASTSFYVKEIETVSIGLCGRWVFDANTGYQVPDLSGGGRPILLTNGTGWLRTGEPVVSLQGPVMTADGFILADQIVTPTGYELTGFSVKQTGTETSTITVKETSSGGTTVATATLSATQTRVKGTVATPFQADNKKLHLANSSWAGNTVTPYFHFTRSLN